MLDRFKLAPKVIGSFVFVAIIVAVVGGLGYYCIMDEGAANMVLGITVVAALGIVIWGVLLARSITAPLTLIARMSQEMGQRHLGMRLRMNRQDEIGVVAQALNRLADDLQREVVVPMKKIAAGDLYVEVEPRDSQDEIILALKKTIGSLRGLMAETDTLARSVARGKLASRVGAHGFQGGYQAIVQQINHALDSMTGPFQVVARQVGQIAAGESPPKIAELGQGDWNAVQDSLNLLTDSINTLVADTIILSQAAGEGRLSARADAARHRGGFRTMVQNLNSTLEAVSRPLQQSAKCLASLAAGDIPDAIGDNYNGDFDAIKRDLNQIIQTAHMREADGHMLLEAATQVRWGARADISKYSGKNGQLVDMMNQMMGALTQPSSAVAERIAFIAQGDMPDKITDTYKGDLEKLKNDVNACIDAMTALSADVSLLSSAAARGGLATRADTSRHHGEFRRIVQNVNDLLDAVSDPLESVAVYAGQLACGNLSPDVTFDFQGDWAEVKHNLDVCAGAVNALIADVTLLAQAMAEGRLSVRTDASQHPGRFREVVEKVNVALDAILLPVNNAGQVLNRLAHGDLMAQAEGNYPGDLALLKSSLDELSDGLGRMALKAQQASFGMSAATARILATSSEMASTARQQASTVIQVAHTVHETKSSAEQSVQHAQEMARVISELASVVEASAQAAQQIVSGVEQETSKLDQISTSMDDINQTVQHALETAQQWQEMAQNLTALSEQLKLAAAHYRL